MTVNHTDVADRVHRRYPFFDSSNYDRQRLFDRDANQIGFAQAS
jgi:hypothetical protein